MMVIRVLLTWIVLSLGSPGVWASLQADQLLLVANQNVPESVDLARYYASVRGVPSNHILSLDLPVNERILPLEYQKRLVQPIREYLKAPPGTGVRCVVLFYGVPLRVMPDEATQEQKAEIASLKRIIEQLDQKTPPVAQEIEAFASRFGIQPRAFPGPPTASAQMRVMSVFQQMQQKLNSLNPQAQAQVVRQFEEWQAKLQQIAREAVAGASNATTRPNSPATQSAPLSLTHDQAQSLANQPRNPQARLDLRSFVASTNGAFGLYQLVESQLLWINVDETDASVDSELVLALMPDYPRYRWQANPWQRPLGISNFKPLMTCRIDAPNPQIARRIIDDSIHTEKNGLYGTVVFDSRGLPEKNGQQLDGYGWYDQAIRNAAKWVSEKTKLHVVTDDQPQVLLPHTVENVATYIGWYSLQNYIPGCRFVPGAVGYHVASLELTSLRDPASKEWVSNLLRDGIAATLGAVSEPYLHAFPRPDEFFPVLYTGRYTLVETYWLTVPMTSWKLILIGDPLYNPYASDPAVRWEDLFPQLRSVLEKIEGSSPNGR